MSRKILIAGIILILALVGLAFYFFSSKSNAPGTNSGGGFFGGFFSGGSNLPSAGENKTVGGGQPSGTTTNPTTQLAPENKAKLVRISKEPVVGAAVRNREGRIRYFKKASGNLFENSFIGNDEKRISNVTIPAILDAVWSHSKNAVALAYYDGGDLKRYYFQYTGTSTQSSGFLPSPINSLAMAEDAEAMVYTTPASGSYAVVTALPNNTKQKTVLTTPISDFEVSWPASNLIALKTRTSAFAPGFLYSLDPSRGAFTKLLGDIEGLDVLWAPGGKRFLYSRTSIEGHTLELFSYDLSTGAQQKLEVITVSEKCLWSAKNPDVIFCAVPQQPPRSSLPDDWWQGKVSFNDVIFRINLKTGVKQQFMAANLIDATHMLLSIDEQYLFFINKKDDSLWSLKIN